MALQVVGAGLGRTGTMSLKLALERLLGGRCYHMLETFDRPEDGSVWIAASNGAAPDWNAFLTEYNAAVDWPACDFWQQLADANPDALVLLSTRESADAWWKSASETIFGVMRQMASAPEGERPWQAEFFASRAPVWADEEAAKAYYERHNAEVRATAPSDRFLDYCTGDGWAPLCDALGVAVPDEPYPHANTTDDFRKMFEGRQHE